ncbi:MAG: hypothetical protein EOO73_30595 [Myxococcales bacterium]|nr:MAG: hypothetical protein EOO73_30595 [Myxococcales bacterium]
MIRSASMQLRKCSVARWSAMAAQVVSLALLVAGCASGDPSAAPSPAPASKESVGSISQAVNGVDGSRTILAGSVIVNQYTTLAANAAAGDGTITVGDAGALNPGGDALAQGDLLMIIQMQGATIDTSDPASRSWGQVTSLGSAGNFELVEVASVLGNVVTVQCGLKNSYVTTGAVQVIRVPQYTTLNVSVLAEIVAPAWNGATGGVVAIRAQNTINLGGNIDVTGLGFRGGVADGVSDDAATDVTTYASATNTQGGGKGESIAGRLTLYGRGAPANGGGGGNSHNAGGGGGANGRTALQAAWTGQGVMKNVTGATGGATDAWRLDPAYIANGNARTASSGGGRGGYTYSSANQNATAAAGAPELAVWGGNSRRERGGLGGRPLDNSPTGRLFFGGGGGTGDANNGNQGLGGRGGGIVFLMAGSVTGGGSILASGAAGENADSTDGGSASGDAPGGGGGGGSVVVQSASLASVVVRADGGAAGNQFINNAEAEGPAGGGGGGYLALPTTQTTVTLSAAGAIGGTTSSPSLSEFPTNGATAGSDGETNGNSTLVSMCTTGPTTTITASEPALTNDPTGDFEFAGTPSGGTFECSLDSGAWAACTAIYSTAALADGSHTLRVRSVDSLGFRDSTPASHTWVLDTAPPDTTLGAKEPSPTNDPTGDFTFTSPEATATFECSVDGGAYAPCTSPYSTTALADGQHTLDVRAKDLAGNVDPSPANHTWTVDVTAPDTTIKTAEPNPTNDPTGDFVFESNEAAATFECSLDGAAYAVCNATYSTPTLADGLHKLSVRAKDASGNVDAIPATYEWLVDTGAPETAISLKEPSPTNDPTGDFGFTSNDPMALFECSIDGSAFASCNAAFSTPALNDGQHTIAVRARDLAGNVDATPDTYQWTIDTVAPGTTIKTAEPNPTNDPTGDFVFESNDLTASFECSLDGGAYAPCNATYSTPALVDGSHTLSVRAKDAAGNVDPNPETYTWTVDATAPETTLGAKEPTPTNDPTGDFTFSSNDGAATFECSVDGAAYAACESPFSTAALSDGSHTLNVRAKDAAGNVDATPATHTWVVDTVAPTTAIQTSEPNPTNDPTGDFVFTSNDNAAKFECSIDGAAFEECSAIYSTATLADGEHTLRVRAKDLAGNTDATPEPYTWVVDTTAPETTIVTKEPTPTNDPTGDFTFTSNDAAAKFECSVDGAAYAECAATFSTAALSDGPHNLAVRAKDALGNVDATPETYDWVVDTTPPTTAFEAKEPNPTGDSTGDFVFSSNDLAAKFECSIDGGAFAECAATFSTPELADGLHTIAVRAKDAAGNVDATPESYEWSVDATVPDTTITSSEPDPTNDPTGDFVFASNDSAATFECSLDGAAFAPCAATFSTASLPDGSHTLSVRAKDAVGNVDPTPATHPWTVDTAPPETTIPTFEPSPTNDVSGDFVFASSEVGSTFECRVDAAAFAPCSAAFSTTALGAGPHTIEARATDRAGNVDATPASYTWTVTAPPATDTDGDGLPDTEEDELGTDKNDADSDNDGVIDGEEQHPGDDPDADGLINALDPDSDNDGLFDGTELGITTPDADTDLKAGNFIADADPATHTDPEDADTDDGTVPDGAEDSNHDGKVDAEERDPRNPADDVTLPLDTDDDGLTDAEEDTLGTDPLDADSDNDGVLDGAEPNPSSDTDGDGFINPLDPDSDNDGLFDGTELGLDCTDPDTNPNAGTCKADADPGTVTLPLDPDTDDGGVNDGSEDANLDGALDPGETDPTAGQGADDGDNLDPDGDGLSTGVEETLGTDPNDADTDNDGLLDGDEPNPTLDSDGDGLNNPLDPDSDNDGLFDGTESGKDCSSPATAAGSCIPDADPTTTTSPIDADTDDGGVIDGSEDSNLDGKLDAGETDPTAGHGADDGTNQDADGDGLSNGVETTVGSDPNDADSDDDGLLDGEEPNFAADTDGDGKPNILDSDSDDDGLFDGTEAGKPCDNDATSASEAQCIADADPATRTGVLDPDTDDGGVNDGDEDSNHDGALDEGERDPLDPSDDENVPGEGGAGGMPATGGSAGSAGTAGNGGNGGNGATPGLGGAGGDDTGGTSAGGTTGGADSKRPVVLGGGICSVTAPGGETSGALALLGIAAAAAIVSRRRRRA